MNSQTTLPAAVRRKAEAARKLIEGDKTAAPAATPSDANPELTAANAEIARLTKELQTNRVEEGRARTLATDLKEAKEKLAAIEAEQKRKIEAGDVTSLSEEDLRLLADLKDPMLKIAREVFQQEGAALLKPLLERTDRLERMSEAQYTYVMDEEVPGWKTQNEDPHFLAWLNQVDPGTQRLRADLVQRADAAKQGYVVAEIFKAFTEQREIQHRGAAQPRPQNLDHGPGSGNQPPLEDKVVNTITRPYIAAFFRDKTRGHYKGREKEAAEIEANINAAVTEGRVVNA